MDIILIPGLWLDAASWDPVLPTLVAAGHRPHALTLPGVGEPESESADIRIADWVADVVRLIDTTSGDIALVGHSGGGNVAWGAADARPDRVNRVILVDTVPPPSGAAISEFDIVDGVVPFPGWDFFPTEDTADLTPEIRATSAARALSVPARVPTDPIQLTDAARYTVPVTMLSGSLDAEQIIGHLSDWGSYGAEIAAIESFDVVRIDSGHWPQFSAPERLGALIRDALTP
ncbi:MAG: alpha/beta fold hydrolase [Actinomycetota bacterium]